MDADLKYKYFKEWLDNGGDLIFPPLIEDLKKIKFDDNGKVIAKSITPAINSAMLSIIATHLDNPHFDGKSLSEYKSIIQKEQFFDQINIEAKDEFDSFYKEYIEKKEILFRGVKESKWRLYNSLQRFWILNDYLKKEIPYQGFLKNLVDNARKQNNNLLTNFLKINGISPENDIAILSFLQHYGCQTPLLDWTYNLDIALFFGSENLNKDIKLDIDNYFSIYILEEKHIKNSSLRNIVNEVLKSLESKVKEDTSRNAELEGIDEENMNKFFSPNRLGLTTKILYGKKLITKASTIEGLFIYPMAYFSDTDEKEDYLIPFSLNNNLNVVNQNGVFIFNNNPIKSLEENSMDIYKENNPHEDNYRFCICVNINKSLEDYIIQKLNDKGINKSYIYPDPYKLSEDIFFKTIEKT